MLDTYGYKKRTAGSIGRSACVIEKEKARSRGWDIKEIDKCMYIVRVEYAYFLQKTKHF